MTTTLYLCLAVLVGAGAAMQSALLAAMSREKGPFEGTWVNILGALGGVALILAVRGFSGRSPMLPAPFSHAAAFAVVAALLGSALVISARGLDPVYATAGLFAVAYLLGISYGAPQIGIALFVAGVTAGQLGGALVFDHAGAFGNEVREVSVSRIVGLGAVLAGVLIVRFGP